MKLKAFSFALLAILLSTITFAQKKTVAPKIYAKDVERPKLVVGLVIDQMRWDYLYKYYSRYGNGGFKRLINEGFSAENTYIPYTPTYTACGHASIYTGSVPSLNGIIGNNWYDQELKRDVYCVEDKSVKGVGGDADDGQMSPKNLLTTTITDELRLATNFQGKTIAISLKDRASILPGGHTSNGSYWYDSKYGNFITSTFYAPTLPTWVSDYNKIKLPNKFYENNWVPLYPINTYTLSTADEKAYESKFRNGSTTFPHNTTEFIDKNWDVIRGIPAGNTMVLDFAKTAILAEDLGKDAHTDFLAVSCSSTDVIGHAYGPNSIEVEDTYLRLDKDIEEFFNYLDKQVGKGNYLLFLSSDHGVLNVPGFLKENKLPSGLVSNRALTTGLNKMFVEKFNLPSAVVKIQNNQVFFDKLEIDSLKADYFQVKMAAVKWLKLQEGINDAVDIPSIGSYALNEEVKKRIINGYNARRSGEVYYILKAGYYDGGATGTSHGSWNPYDAHIPLVFMGWKVKPGKTNKTYYMSDIAATLAAMLHIQVPSGSIGNPITELTHQ